MLKLILIFSLISTTFAQTSSPRETMETFLKSMVQIKKQNLNHDLFYNQAISTLDLSSYNTNIQFSVGKKYANTLIYIFDRLEKIDYETIPSKLNEKEWVYDKTRDNVGSTKEISLALIEGKWLFTKATLKSLDFYVQKVKNKDVVKDVVGSNLVNGLKNSIPKTFQKKVFLIENWQWLGLIILLLSGFILIRVIGGITEFIVNKNSKIFEHAPDGLVHKSIIPFRRLAFVIFLISTVQYLDFGAETLSVINRVLLIARALILVWLLHKIVEMGSYYFTQRSLKTANKFDDILIPLLTKTIFILLYLVGGVLIAQSFNVDVTGIIAGLGIGGLAFAFAAKDTLANFFGSIMLVLDRPFDIGDSIRSGDIEGTVVEVGFRSTKVKTFYDSIVSVSNGQLANKAIDNLGKRRYRRLSTTLGVEYDTPPELIESFCEGIRQIILSHKWTRKDNFNVYFVNFGASSLDIQLMVFWETPEYAREQAEKHRLMIDILRLAKEMGINFAFPTQTVHMFNETQKSQFEINEEYFTTGIEKAKRVTAKPLSLKNPRSNINDREQFGDNDF
jgi:MscS family membrane protein